MGSSLLGEVVVPIMRWERFVGGSGLVNKIKSFVFDMLIVKCLRNPSGDVRQSVEHEWRTRNINLKLLS